jgi:hypothetical protein
MGNTKELQCLAAGTSRRTSLSVRARWSRVVMPCRGSRRVVARDCSLWDTWPSPRVDWAHLGSSECFPSLPRPSLSLGSCARRGECLGLSLACGSAGDDGDVTAARLVRPALRFLPG